MDHLPIRRALISVSDKTGLVELGQALAARNVEILSTGGTRQTLEAAGLAVRDVAEYTGFPEMLDGRLKTLHPKIFGGILCRLDRPDDLEAIGPHGIAPIELVVVNLYPFEQTIARPGVTPPEAIEQIDIGGPSLVRAAAKNHAFIAIATSPAQYGEIIAALAAEGGVSLSLRKRLAADAFARTAAYERAIADYFASYATAGEADATAPEFPPRITVSLERQAILRYGENPHQAGAVYRDVAAPAGSLLDAEQLGGKELSYNNLLDLDSAWAIVRDLARPSAAVIKHNNPCGAAAADTLAAALSHALAGDPLSAFGSVLGLNRPVDVATAERLCEPGLFIEAIVAPDFEPAALELLRTRPKWKANVRLLRLGPAAGPSRGGRQLRPIDGGCLVQDADVTIDDPAEWQTVTTQAPGAAQLAELDFAWRLVRQVKSNAIVVCRDHALLGAGAGQMSRVDSVEIALAKAGDRAQGAVLASDAFFPFADSIHRAAAAGVAAIVQPGGSKNDDEVIQACNEHGLPMLFTGRRHFKH